MLNILDTWIEAKWDVRRWDIALRTEKPVETYQQMIEASRSADDHSIDDLSQEERDWLRNSG
jgi:hypothetical protein